jgi:hypothetical protein
LKSLRTVLEGVFFTAAAGAATVASAYSGADPTAMAASAGAIALALAGSATSGALGNFTFREVSRVSDQIVDRLSHGGVNGELPLNHDIARAVRIAQLRAVEAIAHRIISSLKPTEADRSAQFVIDRLDSFLDGILKWRRSAEEDIKTRWFELSSREEVETAAQHVRNLLADGDEVARVAAVWTKSGGLVLAELDEFPVSDRPPLFDAVLAGRADIEKVTWANAASAFFFETLKNDAAVYRIFSIELLKYIGIDIQQLSAQVAAQGESILLMMQECSGPVGQALAWIDRRLQQLVVKDEELAGKLDRILSILATVPIGEADARLERWVGSEYANWGLTAARVRDLIAESTRFFVGRETDLALLDDFLADHRRGLLIVAAPAGVGKSAMLAGWIRRRQETGDFVARHVIARRVEETAAATAVLEHLLQQVRTYRAAPAALLPSNDSRLRGELFEHLKPPARQGERLIVLLDGLDEADAPLAPFAHHEMGSGVYVVLGVRTEAEAEPEVLKRWLIGGLGDLPRMRHDLKPMTVNDVVLWLRAAMPSARFLHEDEIALALHRTTGGVPLFLRFVLEDLGRRLQKGSLEEARKALAVMPSSFIEYVHGELDELGRLGGSRWSNGARRLFSVLTQTFGPISARELHISGLASRDLDLMRLDHLIERWFSISGWGAERTFAFAHPRLAEMFGKVLGFYAEDARKELVEYCDAWSEHKGAYALAYAPDHLLAAAQREGWTKDAIERAAEPLLSLAFHQARLKLPIADYLMARVPHQLRVLAEKADAVE